MYLSGIGKPKNYDLKNEDLPIFGIGAHAASETALYFINGNELDRRSDNLVRVPKCIYDYLRWMNMHGIFLTAGEIENLHPLNYEDLLIRPKRVSVDRRIRVIIKERFFISFPKCITLALWEFFRTGVERTVPPRSLRRKYKNETKYTNYTPPVHVWVRCEKYMKTIENENFSLLVDTALKHWLLRQQWTSDYYKYTKQYRQEQKDIDSSSYNNKIAESVYTRKLPPALDPDEFWDAR